MRLPRGGTGVFALFYGLGLAASTYLVSLSLTGDAAVCRLAGSDCLAVVNSEYGSFFGIPVASFGLSYFVFQLVLVLFLWGSQGQARKKILAVSFAVNSLAVCFSLYFLYLLTFVLGELCLVCLAAHFSNIGALACHANARSEEKTAIFAAGSGAPSRQHSVLISFLVALVVFLSVSLLESQWKLADERHKVSDNLQYALFVHGQQEKFDFLALADDQVYGKPGIAIHQIVLIYKDGCSHCQVAKEQLVDVVKKHEAAVYLILKNYKTMGEARLKTLNVTHAPVIFVNGRRADGWDISGFMETYSEDCGC